MRIRFCLILCCMMLLNASSMFAHAGLLDDDEARQRIMHLRTETNARFEQLEKLQLEQVHGQMETLSHSTLEFSNQIEAMRSDLAKLQGQIETLDFEIDSAKKRSQDLYLDLDTRLKKIEAPMVAAPKTDVDPGEESQAFERALGLFRSGKPQEASVAFRDFAKAYGNSSLLASAYYWQATAHYQLGECKKAVDFYTKVYVVWPKDAKAPDALLGLATCQRTLNEKQTAHRTLEKLMLEYPDSEAAKEAKQQLKPSKK